MDHGRKRLASTLALAAALSLSAASASAQPAALAAAGKSFAAALGKSAIFCKSKLSGVSVQGLKDAAGCLLGAVKAAGKAALLDLSRGLFDEFIVQLKGSDAKAKAALASLAQKLGSIVPALATVAKPVIDKLGAKAKAFAVPAAACKSKITDVSLASGQAVFQCLRAALRL